MVEETAFRGVITFLDKIGVYDVILPFLLIFTIVFAIFDKTKILGTEKVDGHQVSKKNLNAMVSFVISLLVVASTKLVAVISEVMANIVLLLILAVSFLLLVGTFFGDKQFTLEKYKGWVTFFMIFMFIGIVIIFLNALDWLQFILALFVYWPAEWAATIIFGVIIVGFIWFIIREPSSKKKSKKED